jgi:hypothetical protein
MSRDKRVFHSAAARRKPPDAQLEGTKPIHLNTGMDGIALMNFRLGKVESNIPMLRR